MSKKAQSSKGIGIEAPVEKPIVIVQGAQWGSEAKGVVAAMFCLQRQIQWAVRTGAVNAGHTVLWDGFPQKMQQLPTGWVNPTTKLVLGAGAFIQPEILAREIDLVSTLTGEDVRDRLVIDYRASLHLKEHEEQAKLENRHHAIGATGKGCSVAITDKIRYRGKGYKLFKEWLDSPVEYDVKANLAGLTFCDTQALLHRAYEQDEQILLEGTQGSLLDLHLGPYPYTTHKQTSAGQWVVEAGLAPGMHYETVLVARTFPIRVAGNSGPMPKETTWPNLARDINRKLMRSGLPQLVKSYAIQDYENALHESANSGKFSLPQSFDGSVNFDMHKWSTIEREKYRVALSELPAYALQQLSGPVMSELMNLFELTTVTKKLRRIAEWDAQAVRDQCRYNAASHVVLTFWNYLFPELWGNTESKFWGDSPKHGTSNNHLTYEEYLHKASEGIECPISYVSTGPDVKHLLPTPWRSST